MPGRDVVAVRAVPYIQRREINVAERISGSRNPCSTLSPNLADGRVGVAIPSRECHEEDSSIRRMAI